MKKSIGTFSNLLVLAMKRNNFEGGIPTEIGQLKSLQILDLSSNHLSGHIPHSVFSLPAMIAEPNQEFRMIPYDFPDATLDYGESDTYVYKNGLHMDSKGRDENYAYIFPTMASIDLSHNQLNGDVPYDLRKLKGLKLLNLSMNNLNGTIPNSIVQMSQLETLDFSMNNFSGHIPPDLGSLSSLEVLDLSNNNLSGSIPQGKQMVTFTKSSFSGNPNLYGCPLPTKCSWPEFVPASPPISTSNNEENENEENLWYWIGVGLSYGAGFAAVVLFIVLKRTWGYTYFSGVDLILKLCFPWLRKLTL